MAEPPLTGGRIPEIHLVFPVAPEDMESFAALFQPPPDDVRVAYSRADTDVQILDPAASSEPPTPEQLEAIEARIQSLGGHAAPVEFTTDEHGTRVPHWPTDG